MVSSITRWARENLTSVARAEKAAFRASIPIRVIGTDVSLADDAGQNARRIIEEFRREAERLAAATEQRVRQNINRAAQKHTRDWIASVKAGAKIDVSALLRDDDLVDFLSVRSEQFNSLIRNLSDDIRSRIERETLGSIFEGRSNADVAKRLSEIEGIGRGRARLIARDQASKLNGAMNEFRQRQAGVTHYKWRSMMDPPRARVHHMERNGKIFAWDRPPPGGHPGREINCRCRGLAVIVDTPEEAEELLPEAPVSPDDAKNLIGRVSRTMSSDVLNWSRDAILTRHAETRRAIAALGSLRVGVTREAAEDLFTLAFGFDAKGQDLGMMSGLTALRQMTATYETLLFAAIRRRLSMIEELLEHAAETAAVGAASADPDL